MSQDIVLRTRLFSASDVLSSKRCNINLWASYLPQPSLYSVVCIFSVLSNPAVNIKHVSIMFAIAGFALTNSRRALLPGNLESRLNRCASRGFWSINNMRQKVDVWHWLCPSNSREGGRRIYSCICTQL